MRRPTRISAIGPSRPQRPPHSRRGLARCPLPASALAKLATVGIFGCSLYAAFLAGRGQRGGAPGGHTLSVGGDGIATATTTTVVPARAEGRGERKGQSFRQLNAIGFEKGDGTGGEWKTCRAYQEDKLAPHKRVRELIILAVLLRIVALIHVEGIRTVGTHLVCYY